MCSTIPPRKNTLKFSKTRRWYSPYSVTHIIQQKLEPLAIVLITWDIGNVIITTKSLPHSWERHYCSQGFNQLPKDLNVHLVTYPLPYKNGGLFSLSGCCVDHQKGPKIYKTCFDWTCHHHATPNSPCKKVYKNYRKTNKSNATLFFKNRVQKKSYVLQFHENFK